METTKRSIKYIQVKRVVFTPARQQRPLAPTLSHLSCNYPCSLRSLLFGFCQNWTFSNQIFWRQTIILLPLSSFHWIGDKPFPRQDPRLGGAGRGAWPGQATNQPSSRMLHRALCGYQPRARARPPRTTAAQPNLKPTKTAEHSTAWKMTRKDPQPAPLGRTVLWLASYGLLTSASGPMRERYERFAII